MNGKSDDCCGLCKSVAPLQDSHILPRFVFKWAKSSSATGHIRFAQSPNKRVQDGIKLPMLCAKCEGRFNQSETAFATTMFHPWNERSGIPIRYEDWLLKFCVSISWRVLKFAEISTGLTNFTAEQIEMAQKASDRWARFLLGFEQNPAQFEQHLIPLDPIDSHSVKGMPSNINRYILRAIEMDIPSGERCAFTYAKMGKFLLFGFVQPPSHKWVGSKVHVNRGIIGPRAYELPHELIDYIKDRAFRYGELGARISEKQQSKIESDVLRNVDRFRASGTLEAMLRDERLFGTDAILHRSQSDSDKSDE